MLKVGDTVIVKECHKIPELVGKAGKVTKVGMEGHYPYAVKVESPITLQTPLGPEEVDTFGFREDELQVD